MSALGARRSPPSRCRRELLNACAACGWPCGAARTVGATHVAPYAANSRCSSGPTTRPRASVAYNDAMPRVRRRRVLAVAAAARHATKRSRNAHYGVGKRGAAPLAAISLQAGGEPPAQRARLHARPERQRAGRRGRRGGRPRGTFGGGVPDVARDLLARRSAATPDVACGRRSARALGAPLWEALIVNARAIVDKLTAWRLWRHDLASSTATSSPFSGTTRSPPARA